jgi:arylsulfatase A-like enzyme
MGGTIKNVLFLVADEWRGDTLGLAGHPCVSTPHLESLAADGTYFSRHYTQASPCGPAWASMLTGQYLFNHRQVSNGTPLDARFTNIALEARKAGYVPALFGYTDTPRDPRPGAYEASGLESREWICPGFEPVLPLLFAEKFEPWRQYLEDKGYPVPGETGNFHELLALRHADATSPFGPSIYKAEDSDTAYLTDGLIDYLREQKGKPWFAHFCCLKPHPPLVAPAPYHLQYDPADVPLPVRRSHPSVEAQQHPFQNWLLGAQSLFHHFQAETAPEDVSEADERAMRATYYGLCNEVDDNLGRILDYLKESGDYDDTLIVFCSDHGDQLGDHWLYGRQGYFEPNFHVPLIVRDPRREADAARGRVVEQFTEMIDVMPTILEAMALSVPAQCDGYSLQPFLHGETPGDWRAAAHYECDFRDIRDQGDHVALDLPENECHFAVIRGDRGKYVHFPSLPPLYFDMHEDPHEFENLADDPSRAPEVLTYAQMLLSLHARRADRALIHANLGFDGTKVGYS